MKIITIGGATEDTIVQYKAQKTVELNTPQGKKPFLILEEGKKIEVDSLNCSTGGGATNTAVSFKRLGFDTEIICKVGSDPQGDFILKKLNKEFIKTDLIIQSKNETTGKSFIIPSYTGDRVVFVSRGANKKLKNQDIPYDSIKQNNWIYISPLTGESINLLPKITEFAKKNNILVAHNPSIKQLSSDTFLKSLQNLEILILNAQEAFNLMLSLTGKEKRLENDFSDFFNAILSRGPKNVVVTNGSKGAYASDGNTIYFQPSIKPQSIANTLGAGDAFGSTFVAQIASKKPIKSVLLLAAINASSVIQHSDTKTGLLTINELQKKIKSIY